MKRFLSLILTICFACAVFTAQAEPAVYLFASVSATENSQNEFSVTYSLPQNDVGLWSIGFFVTFPADLVELVEVENNGEMFKTDSEWYTPSEDLIARSNEAGEFKYFANYTALTSNMDKTGPLCTLKFRLRDGVSTTTPINLGTTISDGDCLHASEDYKVTKVSVSTNEIAQFTFASLTGSVPGDCNLDGLVSIADARALAIIIATNAIDELPKQLFENCDMDGNGEISVGDVRQLLLTIAHSS